jgi:hypothetical protein
MESMNDELYKALIKRLALVEEAIEAHDDMHAGEIQAIAIIGKRTKPTVGADASDLVIYGPHGRIRPLPSGVTHDDLGKAGEVAVIEQAEDATAKAARLNRQNAILELRKLRAARLAKAEKGKAALAKLDEIMGGSSK